MLIQLERVLHQPSKSAKWFGIFLKGRNCGEKIHPLWFTLQQNGVKWKIMAGKIADQYFKHSNFCFNPYCWWFRNPKQPPGMYINWLAGFLNHQQYGCLKENCLVVFPQPIWKNMRKSNGKSSRIFGVKINKCWKAPPREVPLATPSKLSRTSASSGPVSII